MSNNPNLPALITESDAAAMVGIKPRTWRRMTRPAPVKLGRGERPMIRFRRDELEAWLEAGCPLVSKK